MKKSLSVLVFLLFCQHAAIAQDSAKPKQFAPNAVYVELLGTGLFYSVNYERMISERQSFRLGLSYIWEDGYVFDRTIIIPLSSSYLLPTDKDSHLEFGFGATYIQLLDSSPTFATGPILGFREQNVLDGGGLIRITFTPMISPSDWKLHLWGGLSFGASF